MECWEKALDKEKFTTKSQDFMMDQEVLEAGRILKWPLRLHVPKNRLPSTSVHHTRVLWRVKGIVDRHLRMDPEVQEEIQV